MATTEARRSPLGRAHLVPDDPEYLAELRRAYVEWTSGVDALVGVWLIVAPWVLGFSDVPSAMWTDISVGTTIMLVALLRILNPDQTVPLGWVNVVLGACFITAPFVIPYASHVHTNPIYWNDILSGVGVLWFAIWSMAAAP
jgi:SPW repeat-containing protein